MLKDFNSKMVDKISALSDAFIQFAEAQKEMQIVFERRMNKMSRKIEALEDELETLSDTVQEMGDAAHDGSSCIAAAAAEEEEEEKVAEDVDPRLVKGLLGNLRGLASAELNGSLVEAGEFDAESDRIVAKVIDKTGARGKGFKVLPEKVTWKAKCPECREDISTNACFNCFFGYIQLDDGHASVCENSTKTQATRKRHPKKSKTGEDNSPWPAHGGETNESSQSETSSQGCLTPDFVQFSMAPQGHSPQGAASECVAPSVGTQASKSG